MSNLFRLVAFALPLLLLPLHALAATNPTPPPEEATTSPDVATRTVVLTSDGTFLFTSILEDLPSPGETCITCPKCPLIPDLPPGRCVNGCCVYDHPCEAPCHFASDCGDLATCLGGCCFYWYH